MEGPLTPEKIVNDPDGSGMRRMSTPSSVLKEVAVSVAPMASSVGMMEHSSLLPYSDGKLGERMQFLSLGSTVQVPELITK